ncbi:MAG: CheR family methyltransferase [Desulfosalsimonadaceae bacterium]|nr:CheR family methyltransferase [Desulfosalsimonadaceae bacterium]
MASPKKPDKKSGPKPAKTGSKGSADGSGNEQPSPEIRPTAAEKFPIIGIGASAGGLEALKSFFLNVPENSGLAYVVLVHMAADQPTLLPELLQRATTTPVSLAIDGETIVKDHVYIVPPNNEISLFQARIQLLDPAEKRVFLPIDFFFKSLAMDQGANAAGIILSGTGTDGTLGIEEIKSQDGLVFVQSEETAKYNGMPRSAIATELIDLVLAPENMPEKLIHYFKNHAPIQKEEILSGTETHTDWLDKVFVLLRTQLGHDFSAYKKNTIVRRIERRMDLNQIKDTETYIRFLQENPDEPEALFRDMLIGVTKFFREMVSFIVLEKEILPAMFMQFKENTIFRAWIPGCSTGEEVYSLAMILRECLDKNPKRITLQLFGTDINKYAIDFARAGHYPASIAESVSPERLNRFFTKEGDGFRIKKEIRDCVVFSVQDVLKDPPFSRLNLLCCRNLLIYFNAMAQKRLLPLFHYTLIPGGILALGSSETIGGFTNLFHTLDSKWKLYQRVEVPESLRQPVVFPTGSGLKVSGRTNTNQPSDLKTEIDPETDMKSDLGRITREIVLERFSPTCVLIDKKGNILHVQGKTGKYLEQHTGPPTQNILDMAREGLRIELASAIRRAESADTPFTLKDIHVKTNGHTQPINLHIAPLQDPKAVAGRLLVVFEDNQGEMKKPDLEKAADFGQGDRRPMRIARLEQELQNMREGHQATIEELESSNEELKSTNEELQSSNEELQSTNEEMESSKEELQSLNEELQTVNAELQSKMEELCSAQDDMRNLLNSMEIATIFIDNQARIKRFTPEATRIINLIPSDIGRPFQHVVSNLEYELLIPDVMSVLEKLSPIETEVRTQKGQWYQMRIIPYRTLDNRIDGAVLTFSGIDDQKKNQDMLNAASAEMEQAWLLVRKIFDMNFAPMVVLDHQGIMVIANTAFYQLMDLSAGETEGVGLFSIEKESIGPAGLKAALQSVLAEGKDFENLTYEQNHPEGKRRFSVSGRMIRHKPDAPYRMLLCFDEKQGG